jgi:chorismate mutase / prephenate dehydratase
MEDLGPKLAEIREKIDSVDSEIVDLLNQRAKLAQAIGELKGRDQRPFFTPERERQVYEKLAKINDGPLLARQLQSIYREIISAARALEKPLKCAYWGPAGTYSHLAALQTFGGSSEVVPYDSIFEVFKAVEHGEADYGVSPIENSLAGVIPETLDMFPVTNVKICAELYLDIDHFLVSHESDLAKIERVYAGPQPAAQCRRWLRENLPSAEIVEVAPTARAAQSAAKDPTGSAIVNRMGAELFQLPIVASHLQDNPQNRTRFIVVGFNEPAQTGRDKTSLMFNLRNRPGELYRALGALQSHEVNLQMIESRPAPRSSFEYLFFLDCVGHQRDANMARAIEALKGLALETVVLGSYPAVDA